MRTDAVYRALADMRAIAAETDDLTLYLGLVVGLAFVLLVPVFRSILVPVAGVAGFLFTIGAAFGATLAVVQWGRLGGAVFAGFVPQGNDTVKPIPFALAIGLLFDALVVRMIAIPAALALMGRAAWWLPRWLSKLPELDVEGAALERQAPPEKAGAAAP